MIILYIIFFVFLAVGGLVWIHSINNADTNADVKILETKFLEMEKSYDEWMNSHFLSLQGDNNVLNIQQFRSDALRHLYAKITGILLQLHAIRMYSDESVKFADKTLFFENAKTFMGLLLKRLYYRKSAEKKYSEITKSEKREFYSFIMAGMTDDIRKRAGIWGIKVENPKAKLFSFGDDYDGWEEWNDWGDFPFYEEEDENDFHNGRKRSDVFPPEDDFIPPNPKHKRIDEDDDLPF